METIANFHIITNNPLTAEQYPDLCVWSQGGVEEVFIAGRDAVHQGAVLIGHPLSGSVKPNESPYKSLVLSNRKGPVDLDALRLIEGALAVLYKLGKKDRAYNQRVLEDFMVIDLDLLNSAMVALPAQYHR